MECLEAFDEQHIRPGELHVNQLGLDAVRVGGVHSQQLHLARGCCVATSRAGEHIRSEAAMVDCFRDLPVPNVRELIETCRGGDGGVVKVAVLARQGGAPASPCEVRAQREYFISQAEMATDAERQD